MTHILVTIGPKSANDEAIQAFCKSTNLFRLNGSHNSIAWHQKTIALIRRNAPNAFILLDVPGTKPRTANVRNLKVYENDIVCFGKSPDDIDCLAVELTKPLPHVVAQTVDTFSVNDGQFLFDTIEKTKNFIIGKSREKFTLMPSKGVNIPGGSYDKNFQTEICKDFLESTQHLDVDGYGISFVQDSSLIDALRPIAKEKILISKIENSVGLENVQHIISRSDAVMIDRGDLAAEIGFDRLYNAIDEISYKTKASGRPLIMATENLESMCYRNTPSKSEVMSLAHSVAIGVDCIMLSEETAMEKNGPFIVDWLRNFLKNSQIKVRSFDNRTRQAGFEIIWGLVRAYPDIPILLMTKSGYALFNYMAIRSKNPVTVITNSQRIKKVSELYSSSVVILHHNFERKSSIKTIYQVVKKNFDTIFEKHDKIAAIYVSKYSKGVRANSVTILKKSNFLSFD